MKNKVLLFSIIGACSIIGCNSGEEKKIEEVVYKTTTPIVMDTSIVKEYVAQIQSYQNVEIRAKVDGYLEAIHVDEGQVVKKGQLLFTIRPREYDADLVKAKAEVRTAELEMINVKKLADKNIVSQSELAMAVAKLDEAKAEQAIAELYLSYTSITAPFDGVIDRLRFKVGSLIDNGTLLTSISNNKDMYVYFNVSEVEYLDYKSRSDHNQKEVVSLLLANNQPHKYKGVIETIEGEFDNSTGNIPFRAKFPNPELLLKHGETGKVQMTSTIKQALIIPQKATFELQDKLYVYVLDEKNKVSSKNITVKEKLSNFYIVQSGLNPNDKILLEGLQSVKEDETIKSVEVPIQKILEQPIKQ